MAGEVWEEGRGNRTRAAGFDTPFLYISDRSQGHERHSGGILIRSHREVDFIAMTTQASRDCDRQILLGSVLGERFGFSLCVQDLDGEGVGACFLRLA